MSRKENWKTDVSRFPNHPLLTNKIEKHMFHFLPSLYVIRLHQNIGNLHINLSNKNRFSIHHSIKGLNSEGPGT